jgi:hypothetical protein
MQTDGGGSVINNNNRYAGGISIARKGVAHRLYMRLTRTLSQNLKLQRPSELSLV